MLTLRTTSVDPIAASSFVRRPRQDLYDIDNLPMWETVTSSRHMLSRVGHWSPIAQPCLGRILLGGSAITPCRR